MPTSPTQKTLKHLRQQGYTCAIVEKWNAHTQVRQDLFGFVDVLAVGPGGTLAVQTTTNSNFSSRMTKILGRKAPDDAKGLEKALRLREKLIACLQAGWVVQVHGWDKAPSKPPRIEQVTLDDLIEVWNENPADDLPF